MLCKEKGSLSVIIIMHDFILYIALIMFGGILYYTFIAAESLKQTK